MRHYRFLQYDVFTRVPFGGNQLAVFLDAAGLPDGEMQAIAREMNYSESTFVLPASDTKALRRVRIFTPGGELPIAGHPVIGTTFALAAEGMLPAAEPSPIYLQLGVGTLPVELLFEEQRLSFVWMHQPVPRFEPWRGDANQLLRELGLASDDLDPSLPLEIGSAGVPFLYVGLRSLEALGRARSSGGLADVLGRTGGQHHAYLFTLDGLPAGITARSRMFAPTLGISEDAATGAATGPFAVYLLRHNRIQPDDSDQARMRIAQGVEMGRPSDLHAVVEGTADAVRDVRVGGEAVLVARGELLLPERP
ncbi:MAG TPA: PhzF family phenazine biosynthesis protein [Ktedonobacterales bacterium]|nr:PhzF family phenazine biosynthesis protein [Ktedonobacterales bacterium]